MAISAMEPLISTDLSLLGEARQVAASAERIGANLHPATLAAVADLLRTVNCYYSNLIEGHDTHPISIERAMRAEYAPQTAARNLQLEAIAHIDVQRLVEARIMDEPSLNICSAEFLRWIHREFYARLPEALRVVRDPETGREEAVIPGEFRHFDVRVGHHIPSPPDDLPALLSRFSEVYDPARHDTNAALALLGAAHHRLLWIHPFGDGNGRVTRLMTDAYLRRAGAGGHGLWTASRGLARRRDEYKSRLAAADAPRWDDYDGGGALSLRALTDFCRFFLDICADQIGYMAVLLKPGALAERALGYGRAREAGVLPNREGETGRASRFRPATSRLLEHLVYRGEIARVDLPDLLRLEERTSRRVVRQLIDDGFAAAATSRAPLKLRIPAHAAPYLFPDLYAPAAPMR